MRGSSVVVKHRYGVEDFWEILMLERSFVGISSPASDCLRREEGSEHRISEMSWSVQFISVMLSVLFKFTSLLFMLGF